MINFIKISDLSIPSLIIRIVFIAGITMGVVFAGDGDVNYSAPYITVDPATGKLITVNPGPELKMHDNMPAASTVDSAVTSSTLSDSTAIVDSDQTGISVLNIALIAGGIGVMVVLANKYMKQKKSGSM